MSIKATYDNLPTVSKVRTEHHICGGSDSSEGRNMTDTCQGDSGGPLMCQRCATCNWYLAGVVSFGLPECGKTFGVYSSATKYEEWLLKTMEKPQISEMTETSDCVSCCKFVSVGGGELQTSRFGIYQLETGKHTGRAVYKQLDSKSPSYLWFLGGKFNVWFINKSVGFQKNGGILSNQNHPCPNMASLWRVYHQSLGKWRIANEIKVRCVNEADFLWSEWSSWNCNEKSANQEVSRIRSCPAEHVCQGSCFTIVPEFYIEVKNCHVFDSIASKLQIINSDLSTSSLNIIFNKLIKILETKE